MKTNGKHQKKDTVLNASAASLLGGVKISHAVIGSIVRLATMEVTGVYSVGGGVVDSIVEIFSKNETDRGVKISEDAEGRYTIEVKVTLFYGVDVAKVALQIQQNICSQIKRMTMKDVLCIDVIVDGIKIEEAKADKPSLEDLS